MDARRFDALARSLSARRSRRGALRVLAGGALGGLFAHLTPGEAAACVAHHAACKRDDQCCSGFCRRRGRCVEDGKLTGRCRCQCRPRTTPCGKACCGRGQTCVALPEAWGADWGCVACVSEGPAATCGAAGCGTKTDNCGRAVDCGGCGASQECQGGACACPDGREDCGGVSGALLDDAAGRLGVPRRAVAVVRVEARAWPDLCLGCERPGDGCLHEYVPDGALVVIGADGCRLEYHTAGGPAGDFRLCASRGARCACPAGREWCGGVCCPTGERCCRLPGVGACAPPRACTMANIPVWGDPVWEPRVWFEVLGGGWVPLAERIGALGRAVWGLLVG